MGRILARVFFFLIAAFLLSTFALYAIPSAQRGMLQGKNAPLMTMAKAIPSSEHGGASGFEVRALFKPALPFSLPDLQGKLRSLDEFRGKWVFLNFWASWCGPCKDEWPGMQYLAQEMAGEPFVMVAVSVDEDEKALVDFLRENGLARSVVVLRDKGERIGRAYGCTGWPETFLISPEGEIYHWFIGPRHWDSRQAFSYIQALIKSES